MNARVVLNNGIEIPELGLGTYKIGHSDEEVYRAIRSALDIGYRHIDTATLYRNERPVGKAIRESGVSRDEVFVTTKLWGSDVLSGNVGGAFETSLRNLGLDYLDLYLVHWPVKGKLQATWKQMEKIHHSGKTRAIGLSNHHIHHIEETLHEATVMPVINQVELHPYLAQEELHDYCSRKNIAVQAWSPLGSNKIPLLNEEVLTDIGGKYGKSPAQVVLRWHLEKGVIAIPKSSHPDRQLENLQVFDFRLTDEEIKRVDALDREGRTGMHPDEIEF